MERKALRVRMLFVAVVALVCASRSAAVAQQVAVDSFSPPPDQKGFTGFASTRTPGPLGFDGTLWLDYGYRTLDRDALKGLGKDVIRHRFDGELALQLGILTRGAVALHLPFVLAQTGDDIAGKPRLAPSGFGDPSLDARVRLYGAPVRADGSVNDGAAFALRGLVYAPIGESHAYFADRGVRTEIQGITDVEAFGLGAALALGYRHRFDEPRIDGRSFADQLHLGVGLRFPLPLISRALPGKLQEAVLAELDMSTDPSAFFKKATTPIEGRLSYRAVVSDWFFTGSVGVGADGAIGQPAVRALLGVGFSPRKHDQDGDGVPDSADRCVHLPEDRDGFQDDDGCADDDNDGDLIVDEDDRCPTQAAEPGKDEDEDGCTDK